ncbi:hypothetical protein A9Z42_0061640 [Trichoderma parareesei]|uniref:Uncharacterized protein n=1 Tax=Trichoderma parareesei TaxID=858221 RepID=A0A2H3A2F1_TRIPA|nr:hypothetical protein A9Z42_0061640 [Trichoderma parareesei]
MSRFVVINEAGRRGESAQPESTAINHSGEKAGEPRHDPCAACVRRLTSDSESQDQPCYSHTGRSARKCFQCSSKRSLCRELPSDAVAFGREFQKATIKRYQGQVVNDWKNLGEKTLRAISMAKQQQKQRVRQGLAGIAPIMGPESLIEDDTSLPIETIQSESKLRECQQEHGQSQVDSEECIPSVQEQLRQPQPLCREEPAQLNAKI